jgi:hypothetical protein
VDGGGAIFHKSKRQTQMNAVRLREFLFKESIPEFPIRFSR